MKDVFRLTVFRLTVMAFLALFAFAAIMCVDIPNDTAPIVKVAAVDVDNFKSEEQEVIKPLTEVNIPVVQVEEDVSLCDVELAGHYADNTYFNERVNTDNDENENLKICRYESFDRFSSKVNRNSPLLWRS